MHANGSSHSWATFEWVIAHDMYLFWGDQARLDPCQGPMHLRSWLPLSPYWAIYSCVTWLIHMCGMTHSYVWHDSLVCVKWLVRMCNMLHSYVWAAHPLLRSDVVCICMYICVHKKRIQISLYMYQRSWLQLSADWPIYSCVWHNPSICET